MLRGRRDECAVLDRLLEGARGGRSGVLVLKGEAGVGKTALLEHAVGSASDMRGIRAAGVQSEMELAFAALHQLCMPLLEWLERLPGPQRDALATTFGLSEGAVPDRFFVGLATLGLLSEAAEERPLVCVVDDAQWLDRASAQVLAFVGRRLGAEPVVMLFGVREPSEEFAGLPKLVVEGLSDRAARDLLASVIAGRLDERVADQIVTETRGNPLALLELPRGLSSAQLAGGFGLPGALSLEGRIEESFQQRLEALPEDTQRLLLVAAAEPGGDPTLVWRAAERLSITGTALEPAELTGLIEIDGSVRFRHPLVRSAVYRAASAQQRRRVHRALADMTDAETDPDRRAWHLAEATAGPEESVAAELERAAGRAQARGGLAAAAAFLERAAALTPEPASRAQRALAAAQTKYEAGALDDALTLLATAESGALGDLERARVDLLRAQIAFASRRGSDAPPLLLKAARELEAVDPDLARATYLEALAAARFAGPLGRGAGVVEVSEAALAGPQPPQPPRPPDLLLQGLAVLFTEGYAAGRTDPEGGAERLPARGRPPAAGGPLAPARVSGRSGCLGRRDMEAALDARARACPRHGGTDRDAPCPQHAQLPPRHLGRTGIGRGAARRDQSGHRGDRDPLPPLRCALDRGATGPRGRAFGADRHDRQRGGGPRRRVRAGHHRAGERGAEQRTRPLRRGPGRGPPSCRGRAFL